MQAEIFERRAPGKAQSKLNLVACMRPQRVPLKKKAISDYAKAGNHHNQAHREV